MPEPGQLVEVAVGRRVVGLPGVAEQPGRRGEQHERVEVEVLGQLVQVPGRVGLGAQHRRDPFRRHRREHAVVQHPRRVHDRLEVGDRGDQRGQRVAVGHVARGLATAAGEHDLDALPAQVLGHHTAERPAPGDQHRAAPDVLAAPDGGQPRLCRGGQQRGVAVGLDEGEPAGVLLLRGPHQPADRGTGEVAGPGHDGQVRAVAGELAQHLVHRPVQRTRSDLQHVTRIGPGAEGDLLPVRAQQRAAPHCHGPGGERFDVRDRVAVLVGHGDAAPADAHPQRGGAGGGQVHPSPGERDPVAEQARGAQRGVEQGRVQPERPRVGEVRADLGEQLVAAPPRPQQALERGPVPAVVDGHLLGVRRPRPEVELRRGPRAQRAARVHHAVGVHLERAQPVHGRAHHDLDAADVGQRHRGVQQQLLDRAAPDLLPGVHHQLDHGGRGHQRDAVDHVVAQPGRAEVRRADDLA